MGKLERWWNETKRQMLEKDKKSEEKIQKLRSEIDRLAEERWWEEVRIANSEPSIRVEIHITCTDHPRRNR